MEDVRDGPGKLRQAGVAMERRLKPGEGPWTRQTVKNQGIHGSLRIKRSCGAEVSEELGIHGSKTSTRHRFRTQSYR